MTNPQTLEHLQQALDCAGFVVNDIRAAVADCDPVSLLVLSLLLGRAVELRSGIDELSTALNHANSPDASSARSTGAADAATAAAWAGTPAPWRAIKTGSEDAPEWIVLGGPLDRVVAGFPDVDGANAARVAADAKLIAAAPALLAIARDLAALCDDTRLQRKAQELTNTLQLPRHVLVPLELLDGLAEYAEAYCMANNEPADGDCRSAVETAYAMIHAARAGTL